jgi:hypothetical protein
VQRAIADPDPVHSTAFTAYAGYSNVQLKWTAPSGAAGYKLTRTAWDPAAQRFVPEAAATIPGNTSVEGVASQGDLLGTAGYTDLGLNPRLQYVYVLSTFFKGATGNYYYADRPSEPRATATPRDPAGMSWLPSDWKDAPKLTKVEIISQQTGGKSTANVRVEWQPKGGAVGYIVSVRESNVAFTRDSKICGSKPSPVQVGPSLPGQWFITLGSSVQRTVMAELSPVAISDGLRDANPGACIQVWAVYPNQVNPSTNSPEVVNAFYTEISGPGPEPRFQIGSNAIVSADAAAMFWAPSLLSPWEIVPQSSIKRW